MKSTRSIMKISAMALATVILLAGGCKPTTPDPPKGSDNVELTVKFRPTYMGADLSWSTQYLTLASDTIKFEKIKYILSDFTLEKTNGDFVLLKDAYAYINLREGRDSVVLKDVPKGDYKSIRFQVGLDSPVNHGDPSQWPLAHALSPSLNEMHWDWSGGYIFNVIEGYYRKQGVDAGFSFHVATMKNVRTHSFVENYSIKNNARFVFEVRAEKYFSNTVMYSLKTDGAFSHSGSTDAVMDKFMQNANGIFDLQSFK